MSIVELQKTVETLAQLITQKNQELEQLKLDYDAKLKQINNYISVFSPDGLPIDDTKLIDIIGQPVKCNNCEHIVWDIKQNTDFLIVPKNSIRYLQNPQPVPKKEPFQYQTKSHSKSKKTCSYCNETGHLRARCFKRLNSELKTAVRTEKQT